MKETIKYPNGGYDIKICRKKDILECIDQNVIDKEIALAVVDHCEYAAAKFISEGVWTGIPFIGNIRKCKNRQLIESDEEQALIEEAKATLDREKYVLFRKELSIENGRRIAQERYYRYVTSIAVNRNKKLYRHLCKTKGEVYARLYLFCSYEVTTIDNEFVIEDDEL